MPDSRPLVDGQTDQRIVCPFCPLHCDDVQVLPSAGQPIRIRAQCGACQGPFDAALCPAPARIQDRSVTFDAVTQYFTDLYARNRSVVGGCPALIATTTDLQSARQLSQLHRQGLIRLHIETTPTLAAFRMTIRRDGVVAVTLSDIRRHADLICTIGDVDRWTPRLMQRLAVCDGIDDPTTRRIALPEGISADQAARLSRLLIDEDAPGGSDNDSLVIRLARSIHSASYVAMIFAPDAFRESEAIAAAAMLNRLIMQLNGRRRAVLLQLDPAATLRSVFAWQTNESINECSTEAVGNLSVRIGNAFDEQNALPVDVQIGGLDPGQDHAAVYVPAATVGIHRRGVVVRGDGSVTLPLDQIEQTDRLPAAEWLAKAIPRQFG